MPGGGTRRGVVEGGVLSRVNRQRVDVDPPAPPCSDVMAMVETALAATTSRARGLLGSHMGALHADRCLPFYAFYLLASLPSQSAAALFCEQLCRYTSAVSNLPGIMEADSGALREKNGGALRCTVVTQKSAHSTSAATILQERRELNIGLYEYLRIGDESSFISTGCSLRLELSLAPLQHDKAFRRTQTYEL